MNHPKSFNNTTPNLRLCQRNPELFSTHDFVGASCALLGPLHVVVPGPVARDGLYEVLERAPEAQLLQRPVQPPGGDAEVRLVRGHVVDAVVTAREDDVVVLQPHHPGGEAEVRVRPLVYLEWGWQGLI